MGPDHRCVFDTLVDSHDRVLADERQESKPLLLTGERLGSARCSHERQPVSASSASEDGAALLERASAPSRPEHSAHGDRRAGVASREREERRDVELARAAITSLITAR